MSIVLCCIRKVSGNFQQPGLSAKGGTDSCYVHKCCNCHAFQLQILTYVCTFLTVFCLETIAMNITPWKRKSRCQKPRKIFFNKDHRTAEKHRLLYGRAGSGTFHYKKGTVSRVSCSSPLFS